MNVTQTYTEKKDWKHIYNQITELSIDEFFDEFFAEKAPFASVSKTSEVSPRPLLHSPHRGGRPVWGMHGRRLGKLSADANNALTAETKICNILDMTQFGVPTVNFCNIFQCATVIFSTLELTFLLWEAYS